MMQQLAALSGRADASAQSLAAGITSGLSPFNAQERLRQLQQQSSAASSAGASLTMGRPAPYPQQAQRLQVSLDLNQEINVH